MLNSNLNKELEKAVSWRNLGEVKVLLSAGANVNVRVRQDSTLLHIAGTVEITRELLSCGANIHATNKYGETPLLNAIKLRKELELVRELLEHGADVNTPDCRGNTPLSLAVTKNRGNLEVLNELLKYGAEINMRNSACFALENICTCLNYAVGDLPCAKLLIKFTLIKNFNDDYTRYIDLNPFKNCRSYSKLSSYLDDCVCEIHKMKADMIKEDLSLYDLVTNSCIRDIPHNNELSIRLAKLDYSARYPIYDDIISDKIKPFVERGNMLYKLSELQVCTEINISNQGVKGKKVILDSDSTYNISEYLSNKDLLNFIMAFCDSGKYSNQPSDSTNNLVELSKQPDSLYEASTSSCTKRARLE